MYDSAAELLAKLKLAEDSTIEWKQIRIEGSRVISPARDSFADELAAFGNWGDGVLVLGVDDKTRDVTGIPRDKLDIASQWILGICNDSIQPPLAIRTMFLELPDLAGIPRAILKIDVPRSLFVHKSPGGYFYRQGASKREMQPDLLARLFQQRSQARLIRFDEMTVPETTIETLDPILARRFAREDEPFSDAMRKRVFVRPDDRGVMRATVAGVLFCTEDPTHWLANAYIDAVAYKGIQRSPAYQVDARRITGPLDRQIADSFAFCLRNTRTSAVKSPARMEFPQYSEVALFEAIVNAAAHRDYSIHASHIRLFMYDDRLELYSPGELPNTMTVESMDRRQATRNETIAGVLSRLPVPSGPAHLDLRRTYLMDKRGWGVPAILEESEKLSGRRPLYEVIDNAELALTIYAAKPPESFEAFQSNE